MDPVDEVCGLYHFTPLRKIFTRSYQKNGISEMSQTVIYELSKKMK